MTETETRHVQHLSPCRDERTNERVTQRVGLGRECNLMGIGERAKLAPSAPPPQIKTSDLSPPRLSSLSLSFFLPLSCRPKSVTFAVLPSVAVAAKSSVKVASRNVKHSSWRFSTATPHLQYISGREGGREEGVGALHCCGLPLAAPEVPHSAITAQIDEEKERGSRV